MTLFANIETPQGFQEELEARKVAGGVRSQEGGQWGGQGPSPTEHTPRQSEAGCSGVQTEAENNTMSAEKPGGGKARIEPWLLKISESG